MNTISVKFDSYGRNYNYLFDGDVAVGDFVVVPPSTVCNQPQVVKVTGVTPGEMPSATKYAIQKVDMVTYQAQVERSKQRKAILTQLEKLEKEIDAQERYNRLAASNPKAAELLQKLAAL